MIASCSAWMVRDDVGHPAGALGGQRGQQRRLAGQRRTVGRASDVEVEHLVVDGGDRAAAGADVPAADDALGPAAASRCRTAGPPGPASRPAAGPRAVVGRQPDPADVAAAAGSPRRSSRPKHQPVVGGVERGDPLALEPRGGLPLAEGLRVDHRHRQRLPEPGHRQLTGGVEPAVEVGDGGLLRGQVGVGRRRRRRARQTGATPGWDGVRVGRGRYVRLSSGPPSSIAVPRRRTVRRADSASGRPRRAGCRHGHRARTGTPTGSTSPTRRCGSGTPPCCPPTPSRGSCWTARPSTRAAAVSRRTRACCCGAASAPGSPGPGKGDELYLIPVEGDPLPPVGTAVRGALDDERRTALMRTHSGLHVLTGVVFRDFGALVTGGNMEPLTARMDFDLAEVPADFKDRVAESVNAEIAADRPDRGRGAAARGGVRDPGHHPHGHQPAAAGPRGGADRRHRRAGHPGRRRHPRGVDGDGRPGRGGEDGEQGPRLPPAAGPDRLTPARSRRRRLRPARAPAGARSPGRSRRPR